MKLKILSFSGEIFFSDKVVSATVMTTSWEITILDNHYPLLTSVKPSTMYIIYINEAWIKKRDDFAIWSWVVEVNNNSVKILADMLVDIEDLDTERAERARQDAIILMEKYRDSKDKVDMEKYIEAEDMLMKSIVQLKLGELR